LVLTDTAGDCDQRDQVPAVLLFSICIKKGNALEIRSCRIEQEDIGFSLRKMGYASIPILVWKRNKKYK
jgi:hypothetical protein